MNVKIRIGQNTCFPFFYLYDYVVINISVYPGKGKFDHRPLLIQLLWVNDRAQRIEGFKKAFNYYLTEFSDIQFTFIDVWGHGDKLVKHWYFQGKHNKTGKMMNLSGVTLVKMKDGKIIEAQDFDDNLWYNQQLGYYIVKYVY